jgi:hypothetical protein
VPGCFGLLLGLWYFSEFLRIRIVCGEKFDREREQIIISLISFIHYFSSFKLFTARENNLVLIFHEKKITQ